MKNPKFGRIALLILSLALVIGAAIGLNVNAESADSGIVAHNVVYGEKVSIAYAVDVSVEDADSVKVAYFWEGDEENIESATLLDTSKAENVAVIDGKTYPVFVTAGVPAKELGKVAYATVYTGDSPDENAEWTSYSVVEYLYIRLYLDSFIDKTEADGKDYNRKLLYQNLLNYGANAQMIFDHNTDKLVTDYDIAYTSDEFTTLNGKSYAFGYNLTVVADYSGEENVEKWLIYDHEGNESESLTAEIEINGAQKIVPKIDVHICADSNNDHDCDTCGEIISQCANGNPDIDHVCDICGKIVNTCYDNTNDDKCDVCNLYSFEYTLQNAVLFTTLNSLNDKTPVTQNTVTTESAALSYYGFAAKLVLDPADAANKVLRVLVNNGVNNANASNLAAEGSYIKLVPTIVNEGGKVHVIEYDFNLMHYQASAAISGRDPFSFVAYDAEDNALGELQHGITGENSGFICIDDFTNGTNPDNINNYHFGQNIIHSADSEPTSYAKFDTQKWYRFRFIWNEATNELYFDVSFDEGKTWYSAYKGARNHSTTFDNPTAYIKLQFNLCWQVGAHYLFDDISYSVVDTVPTRPTELGNDSVEFPGGR